MRRGKAWLGAVALSLGVGISTVLAATDDVPEPETKTEKTESAWESFYRRTFVPVPTPGKSLPKTVKKVEQPLKKSTEKKGEKADVPAKPVKEVLSLRDQEEAALLRRLAVCDRLRHVAMSTGNDELRRRAEQLDERAWAVYTERTGQLPGASLAASAEERMLDQRLAIPPQEKGRDRLVRPTTQTKDASRRAAIREDW